MIKKTHKLIYYLCFCGLDHAMLLKCVFIYKMQVSQSCTPWLLSQDPITLGRQEKLQTLISLLKTAQMQSESK